MKRIIYIIILTSIVTLFFIAPMIKYVHAKTLGKWTEDCMITYIQKYYPKGSMYIINNKYPHIDKRWVENPLMRKTWDFNGCFSNDIINTQYCFVTLTMETIF